MSKPKKDKFYLVQEDILPEAIKKTIKVKEILKLGEVKTINEAVEKMDLSRSAYYKYKDYVIWGMTAKILENFLNFLSE